MPVLRDTQAITLTELRNDLREQHKDAHTEDVPLSRIEFNLDAGAPYISVNGTEVPANRTGLKAWASHFSIPESYFRRIGDVMGISAQGEELQRWLDVAGGDAVSVTFNDHGVIGVNKPGRQVIAPIQIVDIAERVLGTSEAEVVRLIDNPAEFALDVHVPSSFDRGIGGDLPGEDRVGDITAGGVTFSHNRKLNHAPEVQSYLYRLVCTNGMRTRDEGFKVDARGQSVEEILAEVEAAAQTAFSRVERQIQHFYELREQRVDNPERELNALARDYGIPDRSLRRLHELAASEELPDNPSRFDIVNLVTNLANDPRMRNDGGRVALESVGGMVVQDSAARCGHCLTKLAD